ncbi:uncharacterized protein LOC122928576 isoform X2 [Bufo gargarizans]|uniref:uncharacterized protein LOC122928576 isoform X2 n=1 Tax=Bufo gargarizans TaxID=30331 RepID=UPI001CF2497C|nr:uncharacterized protein LOC122928576 isoform X2 [Bufo gargarizans]
MNEILKSEIFIVIYGKNEGVSFEEFGGLFRQVHGYYLNLSHYGYSSLRELLKDMNDLVEVKTIKGQHMMRCKSPSRHHVVVSYGNNSPQAKEQISDVSNIPLPSSGHSSGPVVSKSVQSQPTSLQQNHLKINKTSSARRKESKETSTSKSCLPAKNPDPAFSHTKNLTEKTATIIKCTKDHGVSASLKSPTSNLVHARPSANVPVAAGAAKSNNISKKIHKSHFKPTNPKSVTKLTLFQNVRSTNPKVIESVECFSRTVLEVRSDVTYASICANNVQKSQVYQNGQQFNRNNLTFNVGTRVNSTNATQSYPRVETRASVHSNCVIKENIQLLLNQRDGGISVFQLQKLYLFQFGQPLKFRGSTTLKQLLLELKDVVKIEGVGVQMLVFPVPVETHPTNAAAIGDSDAALKGAASLFTKKDIQQEIVSNPYSSNSFKRQNEKLQDDAQLPFHYEQINTIKGHITKVVKIDDKPSTQQKILENLPHERYIKSSGEELSVPATDIRVVPKYINQKPQHKVPPSAQEHHQKNQSSNQDKLSCLVENAHALNVKSLGEELSVPATETRFLPKYITQKPQHKVPPSAQEHHQINQSSNQDELSYLVKNAHALNVKSLGEELSVPATDTRVLPKYINEKPQHKVPPSAQEHHQINQSSIQDERSYLGKNAHALYVKSLGEELSVPATDEIVSPNQITEKPQHKALPSAQEPHQINQSSNQEKISYLGKNAHAFYVKSLEELSVLATDERVSPNHIHKKPQHKAPPSVQEHHQIYKSRDQNEMYLDKNVVLKGETTKDGSSQNVPEDSSLPHFILHSSGFSFVMEQNRSQAKESEINLPDAVSPLTEQKIPYHSNNMLKGPEHSTQLLSNASMILQDTKPYQVSFLPIKDTDNLPLQSHNSINTMKTCGQTEPPALQPLGDFQKVNNCNIHHHPEHPPSHSRESLQTKTVHVQIEKPSPIHKKHENKTKVKKEAVLSSNSEETPSNSQIINNFNNFSNVSSNEKAANIQPKNVIEKTLQWEASFSPPTNDLDKDNAHDLNADGTEQTALMSSDVHKADNIHTSEREQDPSTLQTKQVDEFKTAESIVQTSLLSSRPREEIVDTPKNISQHHTISAAQSELQNNFESILEQEDMNTWQTSQAQVCCIL